MLPALAKANFRSKLLAGVSAAAFTVIVAAGDAAAQSIPPAKPYGFDVFIQGGYAIDGGNDTPYAELDAAHGGTIFEQDLGNGFIGKAGGTVHFLSGPLSGWNASLAYTGLTASSSGDTGNHGTLYSYPLFTVLGHGYVFKPGFGTYWNRALVKTKIRADIIDFQAGYDVGLGGRISGTLLGGLRFGAFNQTTTADVFHIAGTHIIVDERHSRFEGIGPTLGIKASMPLPVSVQGFGVSGSLLGGVLFGQVRSHTTAEFVQLPASEVSHNQSHYVASPNVDAELALTYTVPTSAMTSIEIAVGYQVDYYGGVRDTADGTSAPPPAPQHFGSTSDDLLYHGPFFRLTAHF